MNPPACHAPPWSERPVCLKLSSTPAGRQAKRRQRSHDPKQNPLAAHERQHIEIIPVGKKACQHQFSLHDRNNFLIIRNQ